MGNNKIHNPDHDSYDVTIVGGGMVGASLACALGGTDLRVLVLEAVPLDIQTKSPDKSSYDDRAIALSFGSQKIFNSLELWPTMATNATNINHIHVSEQGQFGVSRIDRDKEKVPALGYVISARAIGEALKQQLQTLTKVDLISPATLQQMHVKDDEVLVQVEKETETLTFKTKLLVAADGGQSLVRKLCHISSSQRDYQQTAIVANVTAEQPKAHTAYERFTPNGPLALLPMGEDRYSLVWTHASATAEQIMELNDAEFLSALQDAFGSRLGKFLKVGKREAYPLRLIKATEQVRPRIALIGNAAHTLHPIAGQGFNLGLRDVATLAQIVVDADKAGQDIGQLQNLQLYADWRRRDHRQIIALTDNLVRIFSNQFKPLSFARNLGLIGMDLFPPAKRMLSKHTMGVAGKLPRLARGLPL